MKDQRNKHIRILAEKVAKAEKERRLGKNVQENEKKIEDISESLTLEEILAIDDYICRKNLLH